jgi:mannitol/fructose-specific phosphotransferase system IIA component (Ntr-type)
MKLSEIIDPKRINLSLKSTTRDGVLEELVKLLKLRKPAKNALLKTLRAREEIGPTTLENGIAIPHCRSLVASRTLIAVGRSKRGVNFKSPDRKRTKLFFLVVAPPVGDPGEYLIALGSVAQVAKSLSKDRRIGKAATARQFLKLVKELEK